jgi:enamine deaminase RidA (YjgF/YER057c/UK114 family)
MEFVNPNGWLRAPGWSHAVSETIGDKTFVKIAGQVGWDMTTQKLVSTDVVEQYDQALKNIAEILKTVNGTPANIMELFIYVTSIEKFNERPKETGKAYISNFGKHFPAITLIGVNELFMKEIHVEVTATAII